MHVLKKHANTLFLLAGGLMLLAIGLAITLSPEGFYASSGITLGGDPSLTSELRAPAGMLVAAGCVMLISLPLESFRQYALFASALVYLPYGVARLFGFTAEGLPNGNIVLAAAIEVVFGITSLVMLRRTVSGATQSAKVTHAA